MIENFAGDGNQNEIVAAVALPVGNPRRPVEPVEFEAVEFLSVNTRTTNRSRRKKENSG
jgi:acetoacetate decarboxylase